MVCKLNQVYDNHIISLTVLTSSDSDSSLKQTPSVTSGKLICMHTNMHAHNYNIIMYVCWLP